MAAGSETNGVVPRAPVEPVLPESPARVSSTGARAGAGEADHRARGQVSDAGEAMATPASEREQLGGVNGVDGVGAVSYTHLTLPTKA